MITSLSFSLLLLSLSLSLSPSLPPPPPSLSLSLSLSLSQFFYRLFIQFQVTLTQNTTCVSYQLDTADHTLWCSDHFTQCDCVSVSSSSNTPLMLSTAELQLGRIINQADLFGVSLTCRSSFLSLYCHQVYNVRADRTDGSSLYPATNDVCFEDCEMVIVADCGRDWAVLTNVLAQFRQRGTVQLPALRQLQECGPATNATTVACIPLKNRKLCYAKLDSTL